MIKKDIKVTSTRLSTPMAENNNQKDDSFGSLLNQQTNVGILDIKSLTKLLGKEVDGIPNRRWL